MNVRYRVELSQTERSELTSLLSGGKQAARKLKRAQILLAADAGVSPASISSPIQCQCATPRRPLSTTVSGIAQSRCSENHHGYLQEIPVTPMALPPPGLDRGLAAGAAVGSSADGIRVMA